MWRSWDHVFSVIVYQSKYFPFQLLLGDPKLLVYFVLNYFSEESYLWVHLAKLFSCCQHLLCLLNAHLFRPIYFV